ncbi:type II toxin-antitoxin system PemK/MazF family toxin [Janibacter alittae]|uniref:Type II toxin-antitoxin system PemK/MazF family toxin n=1 Tax=Janibacter alittae TaxID=3115209 RepID=A0ABZ2ME20_9MICO
MDGYPGDYEAVPPLEWAPTPQDPTPSPGEVVWAHVPYEEDHTRGKDRPVLLIGRDGPWLLGLQLTSVDHDLDEAQEASAGRHWIDIGAGQWDHRGRRSEVRVNRVIRIDPSAVRRDGAVLQEDLFVAVATAVRAVAAGRAYDDDPV